MRFQGSVRRLLGRRSLSVERNCSILEIWARREDCWFSWELGGNKSDPALEPVQGPGAGFVVELQGTGNKVYGLIQSLEKPLKTSVNYVNNDHHSERK